MTAVSTEFHLDEQQKNRAKLPHNIFMLNLAVFHLLMTPAAIAMDVGVWGMLLPLMLSLLTIAFTFIYSQRRQQLPRFVFLHWKLAMIRYRYLMISYGTSAALLLLGWLLASTAADANMRDIMQTVFIRIAIMPVLITVMINFYLESNAINLASLGEIPEALEKHYPAG